MAVGGKMATLTTLERIEAAAPKHLCKLCTDSELGPKFESLYLSSARSVRWCSEEIGIDQRTAQAHVLAKRLRRRRYSDQSANVDSFLELCEDALSSGDAPVTSHAYVNALRLKVDIAQAQLKSHPGVVLFLGLPKPIQDALTEVMRATSTSDEALAALGTAAEVGAGTVEEAEEPPDDMGVATEMANRSIITVPTPGGGSVGLPSGSKPKPIVVKGSEEVDSSLGPCEFGPIDKDDET